MTENTSKSFLGSGLSFPLRVDAMGHLELVSADQDIRQSIAIILGTRPGERVMRPEFGCQVNDLIFEPRDAILVGKVRSSVMRALARWEPRIEVIDVRPILDSESDGGILVTIDYLIKATHDQRSIVYPFFIEAQEEW
jgi:phage baseplate assembly protein W